MHFFFLNILIWQRYWISGYKLHCHVILYSSGLKNYFGILQEPGTVNLNSTIFEVYRVLIKHYKILCIMYKWLDCDALSKKCVLHAMCYFWSCFSFLTLFALFRPPCLLWSMLNTRFIYFTSKSNIQLIYL
jgi:hypothetical protein